VHNTFSMRNSLQQYENHPPAWANLKLRDCIDILDNQRVPVNSEAREKRTGKVPYYGATGQVGWIDNFLFDEELLLLGEDGAPFSTNLNLFLISSMERVGSITMHMFSEPNLRLQVMPF